MKKFFTLMLVLAMAVSFSACSDEKDVPADGEKEETVSNKTENKVENSGNKEDKTENKTENSDNENDKTETGDVDKNENSVDEEINTENLEGNKDTENTEEKEDKENGTDSGNSIENNGNTGSSIGNNNGNETSNHSTESNSGKTLGNKLLDEFKSVAGSGNALSVAEKLSEYSDLSVLPMGFMEVTPGFLAGFDNAEINGFKEGATFIPMMGTIPFVGYVFTLEDGADASAFISTLTANANKRWNVCTEAEEIVTGSSGNKVFFVMCNKSLEE